MQRYEPPTPNCGHVDGVTFTHVALIGLWLCALCMSSIGPLYMTCARCGRHPAPGTQLAVTTKGRLCPNCQREFRAGHRGAS
jgi:hypothetical protein